MMVQQQAVQLEDKQNAQKEDTKHFNKLGLQITIEPYQTKVNFLNITMDLKNDIQRFLQTLFCQLNKNKYAELIYDCNVKYCL